MADVEVDYGVEDEEVAAEEVAMEDDVKPETEVIAAPAPKLRYGQEASVEMEIALYKAITQR